MDDRLRSLIITVIVLIGVTTLGWVIRLTRPAPSLVAMPPSQASTYQPQTGAVDPKSVPTTATPTTATPDIAAPESEHRSKFESFPSPKLLETPTSEADTLHVEIGNDRLVFELYFVDALEASNLAPDRVTEQAMHFGNTDPEFIITEGKAAVNSANRTLSSYPFILLTRWQRKPNTERYYALVLVDYGNGRREYLADILVSQGYARVYGETTELPDPKVKASDYVLKLLEKEERARKSKLGIWSHRSPNREPSTGNF